MRRLLIGIAAVFLLLAACRRKTTEVHLVVETRNSASQILSGVPVSVDDETAGESDHRGMFAQTLHRKPGDVIHIRAERPEYTPWEASFVVAKSDEPLKLRLTAVLVRQPTENIATTPTPATDDAFVVIVQEDGSPVADADVYIDRDHAGVTGLDGSYRHPLDEPRELTVLVDKPGLARWKRRLQVSAGKRIIVNLSEAWRFDWTVRAEAYGKHQPIPGARVLVEGEEIGATDDDGELFYNRASRDQKTLDVVIEAPGYLPPRRRGRVRIAPGASFDIRFASAQAPRPHIGLLPMQTAEQAELESAPLALVRGFRQGLESASFVEIVPIDPLALAGEETPKAPPPVSSLDGLAVLSIEPTVGGYTLEAVLLSPAGEVALAALRTGVEPGNAPTVAAELGSELAAAYPVEGAVRAVTAKGILTNVQGVAVGDIFDVYKVMATNGDLWDPRSKAEEWAGQIRIASPGARGAVARPVGTLKYSLATGDRLVRRSETSRSAVAHSLQVRDASPDASPVGGVHVYLDGVWAGATDGEGIARVQAEPGRRYALLLYKRGHPPVTDEIVFGGSRRPVFRLAEEGLLKLAGTPTGANVRVDGIPVGTLPMLEAAEVPPGLHRVQVTAPGYLVWERTLRFGGDPVELTGIELDADVLARGAEREAAGAYEAAAAAYAEASPDHPDYRLARTRRARVLLENLQRPGDAVDQLTAVVDTESEVSGDSEELGRRMLLARALTRRAENASSPFAAAADLQRAAATLDSVAAQSPESSELRTRALYQRGLALHHLHTLGPTPESRRRAVEAWEIFLDQAPEDAVAERATARRLAEELAGWDPVN